MNKNHQYILELVGKSCRKLPLLTILFAGKVMALPTDAAPVGTSPQYSVPVSSVPVGSIPVNSARLNFVPAAAVPAPGSIPMSQGTVHSPSQGLPGPSFVAQPGPQHAAPPTAKDISTSVAYTMIQSAGHVAFENNEFGKAERLLKDAVDRATVFGPEDIRLAKSAGELGNLLTVRGRFSEAEPYLEEELYVKQRALGNADGKLIPAMAAMVKFYLIYGSANKADALTEDILNFVGGKLKEAGSQAEGSVKFKKGQTLTAWAGEAAPVMVTPLLEWAIACDDIANVYTARGAYAPAEKLYKAALDVKATVLGKQHLSLANSYDSLGSLSMMRHEDAEAESYLRDALTITERIQPSTGQVYSRMDKLAKCLIKQGKFDEAEAIYLKATNFWSNEGSNNGADARCAYALGALYTEEKKYNSAVPVLERALQMAKRNSGSDSVTIVPYLEKLAYVLYYTGQRGESDDLKARAREILPPQPVVKELMPVAKMQLGPWAAPASDKNTAPPTATAAATNSEQQ